MDKLLEVNDLHVSFNTYAGEVKAVRGIQFDIEKGESVAIVGESGCGKSVTADSILGLLPTPPGEIKKGEVYFQGENLFKKTEKQLENIRGQDIGAVFQDPLTSLNPTMKVGAQIVEVLLKQDNLSRKEIKDRAIDLLHQVGIPMPEKRFHQYPHQFSGGMRQRVMIAIALACSPKLLIADEPTTALDVTVQAQIMELINDLQVKYDTAMVLITHDMGVVAETCDRLIVMYAGEIVETGTIEEIFNQPKHPYTQALLRSIPRIDDDTELESIPGTPPDLLHPPKGCPFVSRCPLAMEVCENRHPELLSETETQSVSCWLRHPHAKEMLSEREAYQHYYSRKEANHGADIE